MNIICWPDTKRYCRNKTSKFWDQGVGTFVCGYSGLLGDGRFKNLAATFSEKGKRIEVRTFLASCARSDCKMHLKKAPSDSSTDLRAPKIKVL